ncbi:hypothetical protein [Sporosarcina sp. FSL K6-5500]|uniref:hypothetical protein n=1 Tax=Sporosarcina sp. FSL K6-5500 TaxID=2921558 RepID=UPI0030F991E6
MKNNKKTTVKANENKQAEVVASEQQATATDHATHTGLEKALVLETAEAEAVLQADIEEVGAALATDHVANTEHEATTENQLKADDAGAEAALQADIEEVNAALATAETSSAAVETATGTQLTTCTEAALQAEIEEVGAALADLLSSADFVSGNSSGVARQANSVLAIVNHSNGKRVKVHKSVAQKLGIQDSDLLNVTVNNKQVILLQSNDREGIPLKKGDCLYSSELVNAITKEFAFDFTNQSTHHLLNVSYKKWNDQVIAIITE